jgi:CRISPR type III-A-associated protein Csm2
MSPQNNKPKNSNKPTNRNQSQEQRKPEFKYIRTSLIDGNGNVLPNLISDIGDNNVKDLALYLAGDDQKQLTSNQARKFYDAFIKIVSQQGSDDNAKKIQLLILKGQAEYSSKRPAVKMGQNKHFKDYLDNCINLVIKSDDFKNNLKAFKLYFESLIAYLPKK